MRGVKEKRKRQKTFADIDAARPRYNPKIEGYGKPEDWMNALSERMELTEAERIVFASGKSARKILRVYRTATRAEILSAFRREAKASHPDTSGMPKRESEDRFRLVRAAYTILTKE